MIKSYKNRYIFRQTRNLEWYSIASKLQVSAIVLEVSQDQTTMMTVVLMVMVIE